jgi:hypothetical protein
MFHFLLFLLCTMPLFAITPWQDLLENDLKFIHQTIQENTPNAIDKEHPVFSHWLEVGIKDVNSIDSLHGYFACIERYVGGFQDPHIDFQPLYTSTNYRWPGFIARYNGSTWKIVYVESAENLSLGDEILKIDDTSPHDLMLARVFPYQNLPSDWKASWQITSPQLLLDKGNPFLKPLSKMVVKNPKGVKEVSLKWVPITPEKWQSLTTAQKKPWTMRSAFNGRGSLVSMPYFSVKDKSEQDDIEKIISQMPSLRTNDIVILDLRGNHGGQSFWGTKALEALYGDELPSSPSRGFDRWRTSKDNLSVLKEKYLPFLKSTTGENSPEVRYIEETIREMEKGTSPFAESRISASEPHKSFDPLFKGKLVVLTDSNCASSCLTFLSQVLQIPGVIHVGQETTGNSPYVEGRKVELPSKLGYLFFPMKLVPIDPKEYFKPFTPAHVYDGDIEETKALEIWIQSTLKL